MTQRCSGVPLLCRVLLSNRCNFNNLRMVPKSLPSCAGQLRSWPALQGSPNYAAKHLATSVGTLPQQSGSPPNLPGLARPRNWELVPVCSGRSRTSAQNITATRSPSVAPVVLLHLPQWQSDQLLVGQKQKQKRRIYAKRKYRAVHAFARSRCLGI